MKSTHPGASPGHGFGMRQGEMRCGMAWSGRVWCDEARFGMPGLAEARCGMVRL
jgi:hypothetical protein